MHRAYSMHKADSKGKSTSIVAIAKPNTTDESSPTSLDRIY